MAAPTKAPGFRGHTDRVLACAVSPDSENPVLFTGGEDSTVRAWNTKDFRCTKVYEGHKAAVCGLAVTEDGVVSASSDRRLTLWSRSGEVVKEFTGFLDSVRCVAVSGEVVAAAGNEGVLRTYSISGEAPEPTSEVPAHPDVVSCLAFHSAEDGTLELFTGSYDKTIKSWDASAWTVRNVFRGHDNHVRSIAFGATDGLLYSSSRDATVRLWNTTRGVCVMVVPMPCTVNALLAGPANVVFCGSGDGFIRALLCKPLTARLESYTKQSQATFEAKKAELEQAFGRSTKKVEKQLKKEMDAALLAAQSADAVPAAGDPSKSAEAEDDEGAADAEDGKNAELKQKLSEELAATMTAKSTVLRQQTDAKIAELEKVRDRPLVIPEAELEAGKSRLLYVMNYSGPSVLALCQLEKQLLVSADNDVVPTTSSVSVVHL